MSTGTIQEEWQPSVSPWLVTFAVMSAAFIYVLDSTIANVALPHMAGSFSSSNDEAIWVLTSYLIASGIVLPSVDFFSKVLEIISCRAIVADYIGQQYLTIAIFKHIHIASVRCIHTCQTAQ